MRVGEATHPGPTHLQVQRVSGEDAPLSLTKHGPNFYWQLSTQPRLAGTFRPTVLAALEEWVQKYRGEVTPASAEALRRWRPEELDATPTLARWGFSTAPVDSNPLEVIPGANHSVMFLGPASSGLAEAQDLSGSPGDDAAAATLPEASAPRVLVPPAPADTAPGSAAAPIAAAASQVPQPLRDFTAPCWAELDTVDLLEEFALDCPTLRYVPKGARAAAADATEELCRAVLHANLGTVDEERAWKLLLLRERLLFWAPLSSSRHQGRVVEEERLDLARLVRERVGALVRGEWTTLLTEARVSGRKLAKRRHVAKATQKDEGYLADEVCRKVLAEEYSRAAALLASPGLAPQTSETADSLQELLQPRVSPLLASAARPGEAPALFNRKATRQALRNTPKGSGAALGGGRWEHWRVVFTSSTATSALHEVLLRVAGGNVPESAAAALTLSKLIALQKPGGGVRPIAAPSLLRRLTGRL